ncbi:MAG: hypothetical protein AAGA37_07990 [Actinomycetota bacterium]
MSNVLLIIGVASNASAELVGRFGFLYAVFLMFQAAIRSSLWMPLLGGRLGPTHREESTVATLPRALVAVVLVGCAVGWTLGDLGLTASFAIAAVGALAADARRYQGFLDGRPHEALLLDTIWLAFQLALTFAADSAGRAALAWGAGACVSVLLMPMISGTQPRAAPFLASCRSVWRQGVGYRKPFVTEALLVAASRQTLAVAMLWLSAEVAGGWRVLLTVFGPVATVGLGLRLGVLSFFRRAEPASAERTAVAASLASLVAWAGVVVIWSFGPDDLLGRLFGESLTYARDLFLPAAAAAAAWSVDSGAYLAVLVRRGSHAIPRVKAVVAMLQIGGAVVAAVATNDASAAVAGLAIGSWIGAGCWWALVFIPADRSKRDTSGAT